MSKLRKPRSVHKNVGAARGRNLDKSLALGMVFSDESSLGRTTDNLEANFRSDPLSQIEVDIDLTKSLVRGDVSSIVIRDSKNSKILDKMLTLAEAMNYEGALREFDKLDRRYRVHPRLLFHKAEYLSDLGRFQEAFEIMKGFWENPDTKYAAARRIYYLAFELGKFEMALEAGNLVVKTLNEAIVARGIKGVDFSEPGDILSDPIKAEILYGYNVELLAQVSEMFIDDEFEDDPLRAENNINAISSKILGAIIVKMFTHEPRRQFVYFLTTYISRAENSNEAEEAFRLSLAILRKIGADAEARELVAYALEEKWISISDYLRLNLQFVSGVDKLVDLPKGSISRFESSLSPELLESNDYKFLKLLLLVRDGELGEAELIAADLIQTGEAVYNTKSFQDLLAFWSGEKSLNEMFTLLDLFEKVSEKDKNLLTRVISLASLSLFEEALKLIEENQVSSDDVIWEVMRLAVLHKFDPNREFVDRFIALHTLYAGDAEVDSYIRRFWKVLDNKDEGNLSWDYGLAESLKV